MGEIVMDEKYKEIKSESIKSEKKSLGHCLQYDIVEKHYKDYEELNVVDLNNFLIFCTKRATTFVHKVSQHFLSMQ